ncbi:glycosyltransferase [Clostridium manihotivorum]|uniref:Glycosyl transferase n=1 Tax=Clostridium manihotivorum TaxID=2320868 RepID=A0A410DNH0_9CLOT|nr:glycosyltransferase [Clostridium manihotivorum]QAA30587.1 glycosyl transferase [Clostridium manihotivorum]
MKKNLDKHKVSIIILTYNNLEYTKKCLESIRKYTTEVDYELIVVDNSSNDGTKDWLKQNSDIKCIFNEVNLGFPIGCNQGILASTGDSILLLNNDVIVTPNWLSNLMIALWSSDEIGAVGAVTNSCSYYQTIEVDYKDYDELIEFSTKHNISDPSKWEQRIKLIGFCMLIKKEVVNYIGLLDERFTPGNYEDDDYSYRIMNKGYKLMLCKDTFIHHYGSTSFKRDSVSTNNIMLTNHNKFMEKWGFDPGSMTLIRYEVMSRIRCLKNKEINILDVGCGCGATCLKLRDVYPKAKLFGIEKNTAAAKIASNFMKVKIGDAEAIEFDYEESLFDYIILSEILQHLKKPIEFLKHIKKYLKPHGSLILIIPNAMYIDKIKHLINGDWLYDNQSFGEGSLWICTFTDIYKILVDHHYFNVRGEGILGYLSQEDYQLLDRLVDICGQHMRLQYISNRYILVADNSDYDIETELKFILRRIENDIDIENGIEKLLKFVLSENISIEDIDHSIEKNIMLKDKLRKILNVISLEEKNE